jgi:hypothetical protein
MALVIGGGISIGGGVSVVAEAGGGGGGISLGSFVDTMVDDKGAVSYGSQAQLESYGVRIYYDPNTYVSTVIRPVAGTYTGYTATAGESGGFYVDGTLQTSISLTIDGITRTLLLNSPWLGLYSIADDPFLLVSKTGQTLAASMTFIP